MSNFNDNRTKKIVSPTILTAKRFKMLNDSAYVYRTTRLTAASLKSILRSDRPLVIKFSMSNNNIFVSLIRETGYMFLSTSLGKVGMRGPHKFTEPAAKLMMEKFIEKNKWLLRARFIVTVQGPIKNLLIRRCLRSLQEAGCHVERVCFVKSSAHNGCRPAKQRRI